jgi:DNA-binding protein HU-beta
MTKADIVSDISKSIGVDKITVLKTVEAFMESVKNSMAKNENVYLRSFGSFIVKQRAQKTARNITKNTTVIIPAHKVPTFKPTKEFVAKIKENVK